MSFIQQFFTSRDNNANAETFVGQEGRLWWDPTTNQIYSSDGNTAGGIPLAGGSGSTNKIYNGTSYANIASANGNVVVGADGNTWTFGTNGSLTLPGANAGETIATSGGYITVGNLLIGQGGSLFNSNNDSWALYGNLSDPGSTILIPSNADAGNGTPLYIESQQSNVEIRSGSSTWNFDTTGNLSAPSDFSAVGNIAGNYILGNGSQLTGLPATYGNANVVANLAALGTNPVSTTGNVTAGYFIGNGSLLTGIASSSYGNANVATFLAAFGSNVISTTGNVTGGNLLTSGVVEFAGGSRLSPTGANLDIVAGAGSYVNLVTSDDSSYIGVDNGGGYIATAGGTWAFNTDGTTTFPGNIINSNTNPITLWSTDSSSLLWRSPTGGGPSVPVQTTVSAENGNATISVATGTLMIQSIKTWTFDSDGNTTFPDNTVQTTAYPGTSTSFSVSGNVTGGNVIGTTSVAVGGTGGDLTMTGGAITGVGNITSNGIMAINAPGGITTTQTSFDIVNATATTVNLGGSATAVNIGATTGTLTLNNPVVVGTQATQNVFHTTATAVNAFGAATAITMGATSGTLTLRNPTVVGTQTTQSLFNTVATTVNFAGAATTLNIGGAGNATFSANTLVRVANTSGTALSVAGNITGGNLTTTGAVYSNYNTNTANTGSFMATGGNTKGGTGYLDFLVVQNTSGGATNPYKWLRVNSTGGLEIINSAYTSTVFSLTDSGNVNVSGQYQVSGKQAVNGPAFRAYIDGSQTISSGSQQKVTFGSETFDTNANFASSRFTPTVEGYYQLNATVRISGSSGLGEVMLTIWKNGSEYARGTNEQGTEQGNNFYSMQVSDLAYANGSTDYFEIYIQQTTGGNRDTTAGTNISYFSGVMVRGA